ncbi:fimbrial protein [Burkholderia cepacia]|uniref:fimbrial protein n=1 Tax=Burkholderia cepacia TaxID=292 RepID=UPI00163B2E1B|nr:fimbrial protein [Burkholderia cepacia]
MNIKKSLLHCACLLLCASAPVVAWSACEIRPDSGAPAQNSAMVASIPAVKPDSFSPLLPVGTVLITEEIDTTGEPFTLYCSDKIGKIWYGRSGVQGSYNTWPTGIAGIGVRFKFSGTGGGIDQWWPFEFFNPITTGHYSASRKLVIEFVKTGPITAGGKLTGEIAAGWAQDKEFKFMSFTVQGGGIEIKPRVPTCSAATKSLTVPLGDLSTTDVPYVGATTPAKSFSIVLNCSGGDTGTVTKTYMTLTDVSNKANRTDTLSLTPDSNAKGLGVQVLYNSKLVKFGPDSSATGNTNQFSTGSTGNGTLEIPLSARYIRTGSLSGGKANATASFTMSYQ